MDRKLPELHEINAALINVAKKDDPDKINILLDLGADPNCCDEVWKITPLQTAISRGNRQSAAALLKGGAEPDPHDATNRTPIYIAAQRGDVQSVLLLLDAGAYINGCPDDSPARVPLHAAAKSDNIKMTEFLVHHGADIKKRNDIGLTAFHSAIMGAALNTAKYLLSLGADPYATDAGGNTPFHTAAKREADIEVLRFLGDLGKDPGLFLNENGESPLYTAVANCNPLGVEYLLEHGSDPNAKSERFGYSALAKAIDMTGGDRPFKIIKLLLEHGADPNIVTSCCDNIAVFSMRKKNLRVIPLLIKYGLDVGYTDDEGRGLLHTAALNGRAGIMKHLAKAGADLWETDGRGRTPMDILKTFHPEVYSSSRKKIEESTANRQRLGAEDRTKEAATGYEFDI